MTAQSTLRLARDLTEIDWAALRVDLAADIFDNGRDPEQLARSFAASSHVAIGWLGNQVVGTARALSDGVCNAWLVDVWTASAHRRRGIGSALVRDLLSRLPGQHVALFTDRAAGFYRQLGFTEEATGMSMVVGRWLSGA